eukprot:m.159747 g.159747  ORF g.159747 m.159747 type:complete len:155 (-) comp17611_c0_seq1:58-522(-)
MAKPPPNCVIPPGNYDFYKYQRGFWAEGEEGYTMCQYQLLVNEDSSVIYSCTQDSDDGRSDACGGSTYTYQQGTIEGNQLRLQLGYQRKNWGWTTASEGTIEPCTIPFTVEDGADGKKVVVIKEKRLEINEEKPLQPRWPDRMAAFLPGGAAAE